MNQPFENLGPYRIIDVLGRGGMGTVYRGMDDTENVAAIKVLAPALAVDEGFRERFAAEIETLQTLNHPNIVKLLGFGEEAGHLFYVMELIHGRSLQDELKNGRRFNWREVVVIAIQICAALKHAHEHGVIHRDLKPANLLLEENGRVKLLDFGIAKLFGATMATTNTVLGTADFMAPEQAEGKMAGQKTDLYSLGSVLYALLAGKAPFTGKSVAEVVHKLRFDEPIPVGRFNPETPLELEELIENLLEKNPDKRVPTALALSHRLRAVMKSRTVHADDIEHEEVRVITGSSGDLGQTVKAKKISSSDTIAIPEPSGKEAALKGEQSKRTHFVTVDEVKSKKKQTATSTWINVLKLAALISAACVLGFLLRLFLQPPSADRLYKSITTLIREDVPQTYLQARPDLNQFLSLYPQDERVHEIESYLDESQVIQQQGELEARVRRKGLLTASPVELLYLEAIQNIKTDPDSAVVQLEALLKLHGAELGGLSDRESIGAANCIRFARKRLTGLRTSIDRNRTIHRLFVDRNISKAKDLSATHPDNAKAGLESLIDLYSGKSWAEDIVEKLTQALREISSSSDGQAEE